MQSEAKIGTRKESWMFDILVRAIESPCVIESDGTRGGNNADISSSMKMVGSGTAERLVGGGSYHVKIGGKLASHKSPSQMQAQLVVVLQWYEAFPVLC